MKLRTALTVATAAALLAGCATRPDAIVPVSISADEYAALDCQAATTQLAEKRALEADLSRRQSGAANRDAAGVALIGVPVGSLFGSNVAGRLAQTKGEVIALQRHVDQRCRPA